VTAASRKTDPIRKITTKTGETRYRFIIDVGKRPDGKRARLTRRPAAGSAGSLKRRPGRWPRCWD
jgi:hypothetical protein